MGKGGAFLDKPVKGQGKHVALTKPQHGNVRALNEMDLSSEIKSLEEYEKAAKLFEMQRVRLKKLQQQEAANSRINKKLVTNIYRKYMRGETAEQLKKKLELLNQNHQRDVDRKDALIAKLFENLDHAEEQTRVAQRSHQQKMNRLVELHKQHVSMISGEFERDLKALKLEFKEELEDIASQHRRETEDMRAIIQHVTNRERWREEDAIREHSKVRQTLRNSHLEAINELRIDLETKIDTLEDAFEDAHETYAVTTGRKGEKFEDLLVADKLLAKVIEKDERLIKRLQNQVKLWKLKLHLNERKSQARNRALMEQKNAMLAHCNALKRQMKYFRSGESRRLTELTLVSRKALKANEERMAKAEKILQLAEQAQKYETERERIAPFALLGSDRKTAQMLQKAMEEQRAMTADGESKTSSPTSATALVESGADSEISEESMERWNYLRRFHTKFNKILLDKLAIEQERNRLTKENEDLRSILKRYLDGLEITPEAVQGENPLLIVNYRFRPGAGGGASSGGGAGPVGRLRGPQVQQISASGQQQRAVPQAQ